MSGSKKIFTKAFAFFFLILLSGIITVSGEAAVLDDVVKDFKPVVGYVIKVVDGNCIVDVDKSRGIAPGDLFSVIKPGEKLIHPVTKELIGTTEETKGIIKITAIKSGYSYARFFQSAFDLKRGEPISRYENFNAIFWDYTGQGRSFFMKLQSALPDLTWQDYDTAQHLRPKKQAAFPDKKAFLYFILTRQGIEVRDPLFSMLHKYDLPESLSTSKSSTSLEGFYSSFRTSESPFYIPGLTPSNPQFNNTDANVHYEATFESLNKIGRMNRAMVMTDFVHYGDQLLMAATDSSAISVFNVNKKSTMLSTRDTPYPGQILALKWWQPYEEGTLYLTVLTWSDNKVVSTLFQYTKGKLILFKKRISMIVSAFDLDGDKRPETLLGQEFDNEYFFGRRIKELHLKGSKIRYSRAPVVLPKLFPVYGSCFADLTGNGRQEIIFIRSNHLFIYSGKRQIYTSTSEMGGSLSFLTFDVDHTAKNVMTTSAVFEVSPIAMDIDGDGQPEVLAVASDKSMFGNMGIVSGVKKSWVAVVKYHESMFHMGTMGQPLEYPIQGLAADKNRLIIVASENSAFGNPGKNSYIFAYPINKKK